MTLEKMIAADADHFMQTLIKNYSEEHDEEEVVAAFAGAMLGLLVMTLVRIKTTIDPQLCESLQIASIRAISGKSMGN